MRSLRAAQTLASRSLLLSARSTAPRPPSPRRPLGKEPPAAGAVVAGIAALDRRRCLLLPNVHNGGGSRGTGQGAAAHRSAAAERHALPVPGFPLLQQGQSGVASIQSMGLTVCASTFWAL